MDKNILDKFGISEEWIEQNAKQYESETFELSAPESPIFYGSPNILNENEQYVAIPYTGEEITKINLMAQSQGVEPVVIYQRAMKQFLQNA